MQQEGPCCEASVPQKASRPSHFDIEKIRIRLLNYEQDEAQRLL